MKTVSEAGIIKCVVIAREIGAYAGVISALNIYNSFHDAHQKGPTLGTLINWYPCTRTKNPDVPDLNGSEIGRVIDKMVVRNLISIDNDETGQARYRKAKY